MSALGDDSYTVLVAGLPVGRIVYRQTHGEAGIVVLSRIGKPQANASHRIRSVCRVARPESAANALTIRFGVSLPV